LADQESQKRLRVLEERIEELRRKNLMFPTEKVEELLKNLTRKNAEIYMQRAKKMYSGNQPRTRLLEWELRGLEVGTVVLQIEMLSRILKNNFIQDPGSFIKIGVCKTKQPLQFSVICLSFFAYFPAAVYRTVYSAKSISL
jgi:uncharacterized membrane protein (DUF106 family)